ncbi:hypothetical protein ACTXT7_002232 [Hymenolepis weldensis]
MRVEHSINIWIGKSVFFLRSSPDVSTTFALLQNDMEVPLVSAYERNNKKNKPSMNTLLLPFYTQSLSQRDMLN